jgi:flagellar FliL protein
MADRTTETRNGRSEEEAAAEETPAAAEAKPSSPLKTWLPLIVTVVLMPALAFATTRFVLVPQMKKALAAPGGAAPAAEATGGTNSEASAGSAEGKAKVTVPLTKILVNVAGTMGTRYLMTSVTLVGTDESLRAKIEQNKDQLLDLATGSLSTKTISDLEKPGSRNVIRAELMTVFNNALGGPFIKEIYITELAIQ